jgi:hypothetical protein
MQLERLDRGHQSVLQSFKAQKMNALRWMRHQECKLTSQASEVQPSRQPIANLIHEEILLHTSFKELYQLVQQQLPSYSHTETSNNSK